MAEKKQSDIKWTSYHLEALEYHKNKLLDKTNPLIWAGEKKGLTKQGISEIKEALTEFLEQLEFRKNKAIEFLKNVDVDEAEKGIKKRKTENESLEKNFRKKARKKIPSTFLPANESQ